MEKLLAAKLFLEQQGFTGATIGIVLGTGLHRLTERLTNQKIVPYSAIPGFPLSTVEFHKGNLVHGKIGDKTVLVMQGRFHVYEGYTPAEVVFGVRVMKLLGIEQLFLSNAAGGINPAFKKGDLVLINDHINLQPGSPLAGTGGDLLGPRFTDLSEPYSKILAHALQGKAADLGLGLKYGVYAAVHGPHLETKAEYRYLQIIGADMVGMSTVPEVIAANQASLPCAALSVITDECDPLNLKPVNIAEIIEVAGKADEKLARLFYETILAL